MRRLFFYALILLIYSFGIMSVASINDAFAQSTGLNLCVEDFKDSNRNGQKDESEEALPGVEVFLQQNGTVVGSMVTTLDVDCLNSLQPGEYTIQFNIDENLEAVTATTLPIVLGNENVTVNFGAAPINTTTNGPRNEICVMVFFDENTNGVRESTEGLLAGIDVNLWEGEVKIVQTAVTNTTSTTCFRNLAVAEYRIIIPPSDNHILVSRRDVGIVFQDSPNSIIARFGARPINPLSDTATINNGDQTVQLNQQERLSIALLGSVMAMAFIIGLGVILYGLIRK